MEERRSAQITSNFQPPVEGPDTNVPLSNKSFKEGFNDCNFIGAGLNNSIIDSQKCSIINGSVNYISGKYNCHIIGDYIGIEGVTDVKDNSFNVGCYNGMDVWGQLTIKRGDVIVAGDVIAFTSSDDRLKDDQTPISGALQKISTLDPIEFNWSDKQGSYSGRDIGLIAQQVQSIAPEIVTERSDGYLAMKYDKMVPLLVGAIQDQQKIIDEMRNEIDDLKLKINH